MIFPTVLIIKTGALGDVVRTTPLLELSCLKNVTWFTASSALPLLIGCRATITSLPEELDGKHFDLVWGLEDDRTLLQDLFSRFTYTRVVGSFFAEDEVSYSLDSADWFDMGLISRYGIEKANILKLQNRRSYQEHLFSMIGESFTGQEYYIPETSAPVVKYDIAVAPGCSDRWPMKQWLYFDQLITKLRDKFSILTLPPRENLLSHLEDISTASLVISNDSLPMHLALALKKEVLTFFTCTSPWEIHDYNRLTKLVSPRLEQYFYSRDFDEAGCGAIALGQAYHAVNLIWSRLSISAHSATSHAATLASAISPPLSSPSLTSKLQPSGHLKSDSGTPELNELAQAAGE